MLHSLPPGYQPDLLLEIKPRSSLHLTLPAHGKALPLWILFVVSVPPPLGVGWLMCLPVRAHVDRNSAVSHSPCCVVVHERVPGPSSYSRGPAERWWRPPVLPMCH